MRIDSEETFAAAATVTPRQCDTLFAALLVHDTVDLAATLPGSVSLDFRPQQFARLFALARAMWTGGVDRQAIARIADAALPGRPLGAADAAALRDTRARFKQLRFAYAMFDRTHGYPGALHHITKAMGHLQDALRNGRRWRTTRHALTLRLLAARLPFALMTRGVDRFRPTDQSSFRAYVEGEMAAIRLALATPEITAKRFHETRKIVSRLVAMFDCVDTIDPSAEHDAVVRYLGTINGLMGGMHDEMIARRFARTHDYHRARFPLPDTVATRLRRLEQVFGRAA